MQPSVTIAEDGRTLVVGPIGYLDLHEVLGLRSALTEACRHNVPVVVDLSQVTAVDASALGVLVSAHRQLERMGCHLTVTRANDRVLRILRLTGLDRVFTVQEEET